MRPLWRRLEEAGDSDLRFWRTFVQKGGLLTSAPAAPWRQTAPNRYTAWTVAPPEDRRIIAVVSSRVPRNRRTSDFALAIDEVMQDLARTRAIALYARQSPVADLIRRAALRRGIDCIAFETLRPRAGSNIASFRRWRERVRLRWRTNSSSCVLSPSSSNEPNDEPREPAAPLVDEVICGLADAVWCVYQRTGGVMQRLMRELSVASSPHRIYLHDRYQNKSGGGSPPHGPAFQSPQERTRESYSLRIPPDVASDEWLSHCTRGPRKNWPDESDRSYLDSVLAGGGPRSAMDSLMRILRQQRIVATHRPKGAPSRCVCFTAASFSELETAQVYRRHRNRWDFVPYGLAIRRRALDLLGAKPVTYGCATDWQLLSADDRMYFQPQSTKSNTIEWRMEQEWRLFHSLDLRRFDVSDVFAFVRTDEEAKWLAARCRFAVAPLQILAAAEGGEPNRG